MSMEYEPALAADEITDAPLARETGMGEVGATPWKRVRRRFLHNKAAMFGLVIVVLLVLTAIFAPLLAPYGQDPEFTPNLGPSSAHWLGTNAIGRDLLTRLIYGARASMFVAFLVVTIATSVALVLGMVSGFFGGKVGSVIDRCMDALFTFPPLTLALAIAALLGASLTNASIAIAIVFIPGLVRVIRSQVLAVREETFVEAARSVGVSDSRMLRKHVLPNVVSPVIVQAALAFGYAIGAEAGLSFLGLGVNPPTSSWGVMLQEAYARILETQWPLIPPAMAILLAILGFNLIGDGLRDAMGRERVAVEG
jgi:ABC-type dipeptide/oligopeptide/nickel transport system permease subunit